MAGGTFTAMNKIRPGAYINFETTSNGQSTIGTRGIATMIFPLNWGPESSLIEVTGTDMVNGNSLAKIGLLAEDSDALLINLALQNCSAVKLYNPNASGTRATATLGEDGVTVTAKYPGTFGNKIAMLIKEVDSKFRVETYADGYLVDKQKVSTRAELVDNDFVTFGNTGTLAEINSTLLTGGATGTVSVSTTVLTAYFTKLRDTKWNTMAYQYSDNTDKVLEFIQSMREDEGKYVQAVVANASSMDYEGIINIANGVVLEDNTSVSALQFTSWVAGATAGADITESLTGKIVDGAISIVGGLTNDQIIAALGQGKLVLSLNQNGTVKIEKDINSLHTFTTEKNYIFSKNRVIRELDRIGTNIEEIWETTYLGKVSNNDAGRMLFKSSIIAYLTDLQNKDAIQDFDSASVQVLPGNDIDSVIASIAIKPVDSMEYLYMTVNVDND